MRDAGLRHPRRVENLSKELMTVIRRRSTLLSSGAKLDENRSRKLKFPKYY
jgi:hypothetical protein